MDAYEGRRGCKRRKTKENPFLLFSLFPKILESNPKEEEEPMP